MLISYHRTVGFISLFGILGLASCSESTGIHDDLVGQYELVSVNGAALPTFAYMLQGQQQFYASGVLSIGESGSWVAGDFLRSGNSPTTYEQAFTGTWSVSGSSVTLTASSSTWTGTLAGEILTVTRGSVVFRYQRE